MGGDDTRNVNLPIRVTREFADWLKATARDEMRPRAQLVWVLLREARHARETPATTRRGRITPHGPVEPGQYWPGGTAPTRGDLP